MDPTAVHACGATHSRPTILHLGDDIRWNHDLYTELTQKFNVIRTHSIGREAFKNALMDKTWGEFVAMYRPFWNTGGEMGNWDEELMYLPLFTNRLCPVTPHRPYIHIFSNQH
jgi:hypothetical protein